MLVVVSEEVPESQKSTRYHSMKAKDERKRYQERVGIVTAKRRNEQRWLHVI